MSPFAIIDRPSPAGERDARAEVWLGDRAIGTVTRLHEGSDWYFWMGGTLRVAAGQHRGQNTLAPTFAYPSVGVEREEVVRLVSLDDLWRARTVRLPDVLKIDAEGSELQVLQGATAVLRESMPVVIFEINDALLEASGTSRTGVGQFLTALGYTLHRLDDATAAVVPVATLTGVDSENFVALPPHKASRN